jgi:hypothetical protein
MDTSPGRIVYDDVETSHGAMRLPATQHAAGGHAVAITVPCGASRDTRHAQEIGARNLVKL